MHATRQLPFVLIILFLAQSCFKPEGEFFVPVQPSPFENIEINLTGSASDLYVYYPVRVSYRINQGNDQIIKLETKLDDQSVQDPSDVTASFIDPSKFSNGTHTLKITATFVSQSGSLASMLNQESKTIVREFKVVTDLQSPAAVKVAAIKPKDGTIFVSWEKPDKFNFTNYQVRRYLMNGDNKWQEEYRATPWLLSLQTTEFNDSLYVGGPIQYRIDIVGYKYTTQGVARDTTIDAITPSFEAAGDSKVKISWPVSPFYKNINKLRLTAYNEPDQSLDPSVPTTYVRDVVFGVVSQQFVIIQPKYSNASPQYPVYTYSGKQLTFAGVTETVSSYIRYGQREMLVNKGYEPTEVLLVNSSTRHIEKRVDLLPYYNGVVNTRAASFAQFGVEPDGSAFYLFTGVEVFHFDDQLNFIEKLSLPDIPGPQGTYFVFTTRFANNGIGSFYFFAGANKVVDFRNSTLVSSFLGDNITPFQISEDGQFYFRGGKLYTISNVLTELADFSNAHSIGSARFSANSDKLFISYRDGHFSVVDVNTKTVVAEHDFVGTYYYNDILYDPITGLCGVVTFPTGSGARDLTIFNPVDFSIRKQLRIGAADCFLYNNTLYSESRFMLAL